MDYKNHKNLTIETNFELAAQEIFTLESEDIKSFNINFEFSLEKCMERIPWFADAVTEDAYVYLDMELIRRANGKDFYMIIKDFYWFEGVWKDGVWKYGVWQDGVWENGTWVDGRWNDGIWENGTWVDGGWKNGTWYYGTWNMGRWYDGTWLDGTWKKGEWFNGIWETGHWEDGYWTEGVWKDGTCVNCYQRMPTKEYYRIRERWVKGKWINGVWIPDPSLTNVLIDKRYSESEENEESPLDDKFWEE
jgi:hypothetical protein